MKFLLAITLALALASSEQSFLDSETQTGNLLVLVSDSSTWAVGPQSPNGGPATIVESNTWSSNIPGANWISDGPKHILGNVNFSKSFYLFELPTKATLDIAADDGSKITINGYNVGLDSDDGTHWNRQKSGDVRATLQIGENNLKIEVNNIGGPSGLIYKLSIS